MASCHMNFLSSTMYLATVNTCSVIFNLILTELQLSCKVQHYSFVLTKTTHEEWNCQLHHQFSQSILDSYSLECPYLLNKFGFIQLRKVYYSHLPVAHRLLEDIGNLELWEDKLSENFHQHSFWPCSTYLHHYSG